MSLQRLRSGSSSKRLIRGPGASNSGNRSESDGFCWKRMACSIMDPNSSAYMAYSLASLLVLVHDLLFVPYMLAWDVALEGAFLVSTFICCCFWTVDLGVGFITGYQTHGRLELRLSYTAHRYLRTWFLPDLVASASDWFGLVLVMTDSQTSPTLRLLRYAKIGKSLRLIGLVRMTRVVGVVGDALGKRLPETRHAYLQCCRTVCGMLFVNHLVSCAWYALGRMGPSDTGMRWIEVVIDHGNGVGMPFLASNHVHQYITSFHWSVSQLTLAGMDVMACNSAERVFSIVCLVMGLIFGTTLVSSLSASMMEHQMARGDQMQKLRKLSLFLRENEVSMGVAALVQQQAKERIAMRPKLQEEDVSALQLLSNDLRKTLRYERFSGHLSAHGFFRFWVDTDHFLAKELCTDAMESSTLRPHDDLFAPGASCGKAHLLVSGQALYTQAPETAPVQVTTVSPVRERTWLCEAALWSHWAHVGTLKAEVLCQVVSLSAERLLPLLGRHPVIGKVAADYSSKFHQCILDACPPLSTWPSDLEVPSTDYSEMVAAMDMDSRVQVSRCALAQSTGRPKSFVRLRSEVMEGRCMLMTSAQGQLQRVVAVMPMRMENSRGEVLAELGRWEAGAPRVRACCQLPAVKAQAGEAPGEALARALLKFRLQPEHVELLCVERLVEWKESREYGVQTKYLRAVHHFRLRRSPPLALATLATLATVACADVPGAHEPLSAPLYKATRDTATVLYAWLDPAKLEHYATPMGERELDAQLGCLLRTDLLKSTAL
uniref:Ion transport domain-containing protein n=1 Tax=Alexandrium catenella TaxID=2925 RepID=A0A7S1RXK4_ALECA